MVASLPNGAAMSETPLQRAITQASRHRDLSARVVEIESGAVERMELLASLLRKVKDENADVQDLEGMTYTALMAYFQGDKEERLAIEREEASQALKEYTDAREAMEDVVCELDLLREDVRSLSGAPADLDAAKAAILSSSAGPRMAELVALESHHAVLASLRTGLKEVRELALEHVHARAAVRANLKSGMNAFGRGRGVFHMDPVAQSAIHASKQRASNAAIHSTKTLKQVRATSLDAPELAEGFVWMDGVVAELDERAHDIARGVEMVHLFEELIGQIDLLLPAVGVATRSAEDAVLTLMLEVEGS